MTSSGPTQDAAVNAARAHGMKQFRRGRGAVVIVILTLLAHLEYLLATSGISVGSLRFVFLAGYPVLFAVLALSPLFMKNRTT
jgi:hypothetical protein